MEKYTGRDSALWRHSPDSIVYCKNWRRICLVTAFQQCRSKACYPGGNFHPFAPNSLESSDIQQLIYVGVYLSHLLRKEHSLHNLLLCAFPAFNLLLSDYNTNSNPVSPAESKCQITVPLLQAHIWNDDSATEAWHLRALDLPLPQLWEVKSCKLLAGPCLIHQGWDLICTCWMYKWMNEWMDD